MRLSRNKKSGNSRGYAFLEFYSAEVAQIAAEAMDGYIFFGQKLKSRLLKESEVHDELFKGANRVFKQVCFQQHSSPLTSSKVCEAPLLRVVP